MERSGPQDNASNTHELMTDRLVIGLPVAADRDVLWGLIGGADRREICRTLLWDGPDEPAEVAAWIERCRSLTYAEWGFHWVIRDSTGDLTGEVGRPMGAIGTRPRGEPGRGDVGYWLGRPYWGRGVMTEALRSLVRFGIDDLAYAKIEADVFTTNDAGLRLVESVGFEREGLVRRAHRKYGEWVDQAIYGIVVD